MYRGCGRSGLGVGKEMCERSGVWGCVKGVVCRGCGEGVTCRRCEGEVCRRCGQYRIILTYPF